MSYEKFQGLVSIIRSNVTIQNTTFRNYIQPAERLAVVNPKVEKSQRSGSGVDDLYTSHLWYFNLLMFLTDHELPTTNIDNIENLTQELDLEVDNNKKTMTSSRNIALLPVSNKAGLIDLGKNLSALDFQLVVSGETAKNLHDANLSVKNVSDFTGAPKILGGIVKTLHATVHAVAYVRAKGGFDGTIALDYTSKALELLRKKKNGSYCALKIDCKFEPGSIQQKTLFSMALEQQRNNAVIDKNLFYKRIVTTNKNLPDFVVRDIIVATIAWRYTQRNSVCYAKDDQFFTRRMATTRRCAHSKKCEEDFLSREAVIKAVTEQLIVSVTNTASGDDWEDESEITDRPLPETDIEPNTPGLQAERAAKENSESTETVNTARVKVASKQVDDDKNVIVNVSLSKIPELSTERTFISPEELRPFPNVETRKQTKKGRKKAKNTTLTETPEKEKLILIEHIKLSKKVKENMKELKENTPTAARKNILCPT
ncbi:hypothetical protein RN001_001087 [Aquatica leii]|uniref:Bifunctional purine biosynthesis protein ATIC n=1 Tax=Aquatica leii TaxID=1421715 RepID=A0AAN7PKV0_9COLE|nr:hypothetical protein RN001_001087 [Aquatica leii]